MTLDCFASEPHYAEHLAPIAAAIPGARLLCAGHRTFEAAMKAMLRLPGELNGKLHAQEVPDFNSTAPILVASYRDLLQSPQGRKIGLLEHGAGQTYLDAPDSPFYPGGIGHDRCSLILAPGPHSARRWRAAYPSIPVAELQGSPRLDAWHQHAWRLDLSTPVIDTNPQIYSWTCPCGAEQSLPQGETPENPPIAGCAGTVGTAHVRASEAPVAVSFHWHCSVVPEAEATWPYWQHSIEELAKRRPVVGHSHPRLWATLHHWYEKAAIPATASFEELLDRCAGGLLICDNSSIMYEWAGLGWPVLCLDEPRLYRFDVEHGLRFWEHAPGRRCQDPWQLEAMVADVTEGQLLSEREQQRKAVEEAYGGFFDGRATERAVAAIEEHLL